MPGHVYGCMMTSPYDRASALCCSTARLQSAATHIQPALVPQESCNARQCQAMPGNGSASKEMGTCTHNLKYLD